MTITTEKLHAKRLKEKGIIIKEVYTNKDNIFIRTSDGKQNDSVYKGVKVEKSYYYNNKRIYKETNFDPKVTYTLITNKNDKVITCSECGYTDNMSDFYDGCPYCGTHFDIDYSFKSKDGTYKLKQIINMKLFKVLYCIAPILIAFVQGLKDGFTYETLFYLVLSYPVLMIVCYFSIIIVGIPYLIYKLLFTKDLANDPIYINNEKINNIKLISDLHFELLMYYYNPELCPEYKDLIDFEIEDYITYKVDSNTGHIDIKFKLRKYLFNNGKIKKETSIENIRLMYNLENESDVYGKTRKCPNCGASVDILKKKCDYCDNPVSSNNLWVINPLLYKNK